MSVFTIVPDAPFSLAAAAAFGFGPNTGRPLPVGDEMRLAFVTDTLTGQVGVHLSQDASGSVRGTVDDPRADLDVVRRQVARVLSLDRSGADWLALSGRDAVLGSLMAKHPGFRPVLFHSPYEAAAWSVLSQRRRRAQATALRTRLAIAHGSVRQVAGHELAAFPTPAALLGLEGFPGVEPERMRRLHAVAGAALEGRLDPAGLRSADPEPALAGLQRLPGIGPTYAALILLRSTGVTDVLTLTEPRLAAYAARFYGLPPPAAPAQLAELAERWRPYRTWAAVLLRVAGDRELGPRPD